MHTYMKHRLPHMTAPSSQVLSSLYRVCIKAMVTTFYKQRELIKGLVLVDVSSATEYISCAIYSELVLTQVRIIPLQ